MLQTVPARVLDRLNRIYTVLTTGNGPLVSFSDLFNDWEDRRVVKVLKDRGIVRNVICDNGSEKKTSMYAWVANMAPTKTLAISVADELKEKRLNGKKRCQDNPAPVEETSTDVRMQDKPERTSLDQYTVEELWHHLQSRGCVIHDGKLKIVRFEEVL